MTLTVSAVLPDRGVDLAFEVAAGETLALLGPNGAGKSTALDVVAGLLRPYAGSVELDGRPLTTAAEGRVSDWVPPHRRGTALLAQDPLLFPHLSVLENVAFGPRSLGTRRTAARQLARVWLGDLDAADLVTKHPSQLSGGQAQRVALARALAVDPHVLLLDEPMAALDVEVAPLLRQTLRRVLASTTTVLVTHDVLDALLLADRVAVLDQGRVVEEGPTVEVLSHPRSDFAARIAGLNLVGGTWQDDALVTGDGIRVEGRVNGPQPRDHEQVVAVFRPNAVAVHRTEPGGSPRNRFRLPFRELLPHAGYLRLLAGDPPVELSADITPASAAELGLEPGLPLWLAVKATEVEIYAVDGAYR